MNNLIRARKQLDRIRKEWPEGSRIVLVHMGGTDPSPVPDNSAGTVRYVDDIGTIHVDFDNGRRMGLVAGKDKFVHEANKANCEKITNALLPHLKEWHEECGDYDVEFGTPMFNADASFVEIPVTYKWRLHACTKTVTSRDILVRASDGYWHHAVGIGWLPIKIE